MNLCFHHKTTTSANSLCNKSVADGKTNNAADQYDDVII